MIREPKEVDFFTTGRKPSEEEFAKISEWIRNRKEEAKKKKIAASRKRQSAK